METDIQSMTETLHDKNCDFSEKDEQDNLSLPNFLLLHINMKRYKSVQCLINSQPAAIWHLLATPVKSNWPQ